MKIFYLRNKDVNVLKFDENINILEILDDKHLPFYLKDIKNDILGSSKLNIFLKNRKFRADRENAIMLESAINNQFYFEKYFGLSLNDTFWIVDENNINIKFNNVSLYKNNFSENIRDLALGYPISKVEKSNISPEFTTYGMLPKAWIKRDNQILLFKGSTELYANMGKEHFSEFYCSQIASYFGKCVNYDLEIYNNKLYSTCELFTSEKVGYISMYEISTNLDEIINVYGKKNFSKLMLFDYIIGNKDRHLGNFGMLIDNDTQKIIGPAPIFDNGMSLLNSLTLDNFNDVGLDKFNKDFTTGINLTFTESLSYVDVEDLDILKELENFKFERHPKYNLSDDWIQSFENVIKLNISRVKEYLKTKTDESTK